MKGGSLKVLLLLSNRSNSTIHRRAAVPPPTTILLRHLSSFRRRPAARDGRRRETRGEFSDDFEKFFLHSLNSGDDKPNSTLHADPNIVSPPRRSEPRRASDNGENDDVSSKRNLDGAISDRRSLGKVLDLGSFGARIEVEGAKRNHLGDRGITFDHGEESVDDGKITIYRAGPSGVIPERHSLEEILGRRSAGARTQVKASTRNHRPWDREITFDEKKRDQEITLAQKSWFAHRKGEGKEEQQEEEIDVTLSRLKKTRLIPYAAAMLDGLWKDGLIQEAMKLFGLMRGKWTIPEVVIYTAVVEGFCKAGKLDDAMRVFSKMKKNGIVPNAFSYGVIIQGLCRGKRWNDCVEFTMEMLVSNHLPNLTTFADLVDGICKDKGVDEAEKVIRRLRDCGLVLDEKAISDHSSRKGPFSPLVCQAIFGKKRFKNSF